MKKHLKLIITLLILPFVSCEEENSKEVEQIIAEEKNPKEVAEIEALPVIYNSSFEIESDGWEVSKGTYDVEIDHTQSIDGNNSLKIKANNTDTGYAVPGIKTSVFQKIEPNSNYQFSFWIKGEMSHPEVCSLYYFFNGGGNNTTIENIPNEWKEYTFTFSTGPVLKNLELVFQPNLALTTIENFNKPLGVENTIWIDNINIKNKD